MRFIFHPVFSKMSRIIFATFVTVAFLYGGFLFVLMRRYLSENGVSVLVLQPLPLGMLMSGWFAACFLFATGLFASVLTSHYIKGPVERIQGWLTHWQDGTSPTPIQVRTNDPYERIIQLINELKNKIEPHDHSR